MAAAKVHGAESDHRGEGPNVTMKGRWWQGGMKEPDVRATEVDVRGEAEGELGEDGRGHRAVPKRMGT